MIGSLRHKILLCSQRDVVVGTELKLVREGAISAWAAIEVKAASMFSPNGAAMKESRSKRTHIITIRYRSDVQISAMAWIYEERLKSPPRWFKVLNVSQTEGGGSQYFIMEVRLVERGDDISAPAEEGKASKGPVIGLPDGVRF